MSGTPVTSSAGSAAGAAAATAAPGRRRLSAVSAVIVLTTLAAVILRLYQLSRPGYLLGITEYDDGTDLGSAIRLVHGSLPYRDFIMVQPPGITVLMAPVALATKTMSAATTMAAGRVLTALAGAAAVPLAGLLTRHRGVLATLVACGLLTVFPDSVAAAKTVLLEPWLVLFSLLGMLAVFDSDNLAGRRRLLWGGLAFGFAGAVKVWAILPVTVILALTARRPREAASFAAGVAAGFLATVLPFALTAPTTFYRSVILAQLVRTDAARIPAGYRLQQILGLSHLPQLPTPVLTLLAIAVAAAIAAAAVAGSRRSGRRAPVLDTFALATCALVVVAFLWPPDFYYHYAAFLAPFLALAIGLPVSRLLNVPPGPALSDGGAALPQSRRAGPGRPRQGPSLSAWRGPWPLRRTAAAAAAVAVAGLAAAQFAAESREVSVVSASEISAAQRLIPPGACVVTDQVAYTIAINRFTSTVPGCSMMVDGVGSDYALSHGRNGLTGAGDVPAVRRLWLSAFQHAQYAWITGQAQSSRRIPWTPGLRAYFLAHFRPISVSLDTLYARVGPPAR